jgi:hypothetical protein
LRRSGRGVPDRAALVSGRRPSPGFPRPRASPRNAIPPEADVHGPAARSVRRRRGRGRAPTLRAPTAAMAGAGSSTVRCGRQPDLEAGGSSGLSNAYEQDRRGLLEASSVGMAGTGLRASSLGQARRRRSPARRRVPPPRGRASARLRDAPCRTIRDQ